MHLEPQYAIDEGDLESVSYNISSHRLSEEEAGFGLRDFEPTPRLEGIQIGTEPPLTVSTCFRDVTEISTITVVSSWLVNVNCEAFDCGAAIERNTPNCSRECTTIYTRINFADTFTPGEFQFKLWFELVSGVCTLKVSFWDGANEHYYGPTTCERECSESNCVQWAPGFEGYCAILPRTFSEGCWLVNEGHVELFIDNIGHTVRPYSIVDLGTSCICFSDPCVAQDDLCHGYVDIPEVITADIPFTHDDVSGLIGTYNVTVDDSTIPAGCTAYHTHYEITVIIEGP